MPHVAIMGPNQHPLLGSMIGVDFSPKKVCSFDCVHCGVGMNTTRKTMERELFYSVEEVVAAVDAYMAENEAPDAFFLTGSGEPTLYSGYGKMVGTLRAKYPDVVCTIYTNGSLLSDPHVRQEVAECDPVMGNLNTIDEAAFARLSRPDRAASLKETIEGFRALRQELTTQKLWLDGVFLKGVNDDPESLRGLGKTLVDIGPDLYIVRTAPRVIEGLPERVDPSFRSVVEAAWAAHGFPVRFLLPRAESAAD
jgi:wyosine [tRNA(Phe)-imidazoG37] synthetase (radical SAM superfamily)